MVDPSRLASIGLTLVGPTGSGKSDLVQRLAQRLPIELVCMDSMQLYRGLCIGVAAPTEQERQTVPHHLFGEFDLREPMTAAAYAEVAAEKALEIHARGKVPVWIGGTGLYLRSLFEPLSGLPQTPPDLRQRLTSVAARKGPAHLYRLLRRLDPHAAKRLHPNDRQRIQRFLEVRLLTGTSILNLWERQAKARPQPPPIVLGLHVERPLLWHRIEQRLRKMLDAGWIDEARLLRAQGLEQAVRAVAPIGYAQVFEFLDGRLRFDELFDRIYFATRRYAKRQMTWFRKVPYVSWFAYKACSGYDIEDMMKMVTHLPRIG